MRSTARRSSTACGPARTRVPPGLQWEFYGDMFIADWTVPAYDPKKAQELLKAADYKGDPIPYPPAQQLLHQPGRDRAGAGRDVARRSASTSQIEMQGELAADHGDATASARCATGPTRAAFNDPVSSIVAQHGPQGQQQQTGEWTNAEMNKLSAVAGDRDRPAKRKATFRRMLEICEREDPAYTVLHQNATFTAKPQGHRVEGGAGLRDGFPRRATSLELQGLTWRAPLVSHPAA